jgi:hypothetical protein
LSSALPTSATSDDLAVFDRALTAAGVQQLMALKNGVRDLRP